MTPYLVDFSGKGTKPTNTGRTLVELLPETLLSRFLPRYKWRNSFIPTTIGIEAPPRTKPRKEIPCSMSIQRWASSNR